MQDEVKSIHSSYTTIQRQLQQPSLASTNPSSFFGDTTHGSQTSEHPLVSEDDPVSLFLAGHHNADHSRPVLPPPTGFPPFNQNPVLGDQSSQPFTGIGADIGADTGAGTGLPIRRGIPGGLGRFEDYIDLGQQHRPTPTPSLSSGPAFTQPPPGSRFAVDAAGRLLAPTPPARFQLGHHTSERSLGLSGRKGIHGRGSTGALANMGHVRMRAGGKVSNVKFGKKDKVSFASC